MVQPHRLAEHQASTKHLTSTASNGSPEVKAGGGGGGRQKAFTYSFPSSQVHGNCTGHLIYLAAASACCRQQDSSFNTRQQSSGEAGKGGKRTNGCKFTMLVRARSRHCLQTVKLPENTGGLTQCWNLGAHKTQRDSCPSNFISSCSFQGR